MVLRQLLRDGAAQNIETLGIGLHEAVFDAVVDHLDEMPGAGGTAMHIAALDARIATFAPGRRGDVARARRQRVKIGSRCSTASLSPPIIRQ